MKKAFISFALAAVLALAGSLAFDAMRNPDHSAAIAKAGQKVCKAKTSAGQTKTWRCDRNQACCVNRALDLYVCGIPGLGCL